MRRLSLKERRPSLAAIGILIIISFFFTAEIFSQQIRWQNHWNYPGGRTIWKGVDSEGSEVWGHDTNGDGAIDIYQFKKRDGSLREMYDFDKNGVFDMWRNDRNGDGNFDTWDFDRNQDGIIDAQCADSNQGRTWAYDTDLNGSLDRWFTDRNKDNIYEEQQWYDPQTGVLKLMMSQGASWYFYVYANGPQADPTSVAIGRDTNYDGRPDTWQPVSGGYTPPGGSVPTSSTVKIDDECVKLKERARKLREQLQTASIRRDPEAARIWGELRRLDQQIRERCAR